MNVWIFFSANAKPTSMRRAVPERLARYEPVIIVDQPISILRERCIPPLASRCRRISVFPECWHYRPIHFPQEAPGLRGIGRMANRWSIRNDLESILGERGPRIVCYDSPGQYPLVKRLHERRSIYLAVDDRTLSVDGRPIRAELEAEQKLLARVDRIICVSEVLAGKLKTRLPADICKDLHVLPNGYDERVFDPVKDYAEPAFLKRVPRPRVLVAGHISQRIDWAGIRRAAHRRPLWSWVFVGPADARADQEIALLAGRGFVHPSLPVDAVPAWIRYCDAGAVPYRLNEFTLASSPLKAIEYLAMGVPVLSTPVPSLKRYGDAIQWVEEGEGESYARALDRCAGAWADADRSRLEQETWLARAEQFRTLAGGGMI